MYSPEVTKALDQSDRQFKKFFGVTKSTFFQLLAIIRIADALRHRFGGHPSRIPLENKLLWTLQYWREYRTMEHLAYEYNTVVSHIHDEIVWIENALLQDGTFCLQGKKVLQNPDTPYQAVAVDVTEHPVERPQKKQEDWYSGKKGQHTIKTQLVICLVTLTIICLAQEKGRTHDFQLYKDDIGDRLWKDILVEGDSGYQGIEGLHAKSKIPIKKPKGGELLELEKAYNRRLARERVAIEHVNRTIKTFRILKDKYRNRRNRHDIRTTLICAITNYERATQKA